MNGISTIAALALSAAIAAGANGQVLPGTVTDIGGQCNGSNARPPMLCASGVPNIGKDMVLRLGDVAPSAAIAWLLGGARRDVDLGPLGAPGCALRTSLDLVLAASADVDGTASLPLGVPDDRSLLSRSFFGQALVRDLRANPLGRTTSNGAKLTIGELGPIRVDSFTPDRGPIRTRVKFVGRNFGSDPLDLCVRGMEFGSTFLFRPISLKTAGDREELIAELVTLPPEPFPMKVTLFRGDGGTLKRAPASPHLTAPSYTWLWKGKDVAGNKTRTARRFRPTASEGPGGVTVTFGLNAQGQAFVQFPTDPAGNGGTYTVGTTITSDAHWESRCGSSVPLHYDFYLYNLVVIAPGTCAQIAASYATILQAVLDQRFGAGTFSVTASGCQVLIQHTDPACSISNVTGNLTVNC